jgi:phosphatidylethanolamine/phosphatidyl-N-methylethanolamine N-methyltransferase
MSNRLDFLRESIRNLRNTGSVARSSQHLCKAIAARIDPAQAKVVVELGPGDGAISEHLLKRLPPDGKLFLFEINDAFMGVLSEKFRADKRVILIHDSAEKMGDYFQQYHIQQVDYFVSGIPFVVLPETLTTDIVSKCNCWLRKGGLFIQFHYSTLLVPLYRKIFNQIKTDFVPLNLPPAFIITGEKN